MTGKSEDRDIVSLSLTVSYHPQSCQREATHLCERARLLRLDLPVGFLAGRFPLSAQAPTDNALTNADIAKMVKAGLPESIIVREIQMSRTNFGTSPAALIELKKQGASERILGAVLDSRMGTSRSQPEPRRRRVYRCASRRRDSTICPPFRRTCRFNPTVNGKLSMSHNQIKVERAGVPLFSVKWKETKAK